MYLSQEKVIIYNGREIKYVHAKSTRSKYLRIVLHHTGECIVTSPVRASNDDVMAFILRKASWLLSKIDYLSTLPKRQTKNEAKLEYEKYKEKTRTLVTEKLLKYNNVYNFGYNRISIKNQKTLWGSCSKHGNLNFNYKLVFLTEEQADYIVVHELCHLQEFNHSTRFWNLVSKTIPDYKRIRRELKGRGLQMS